MWKTKSKNFIHKDYYSIRLFDSFSNSLPLCVLSLRSESEYFLWMLVSTRHWNMLVVLFCSLRRGQFLINSSTQLLDLILRFITRRSMVNLFFMIVTAASPPPLSLPLCFAAWQPPIIMYWPAIGFCCWCHLSLALLFASDRCNASASRYKSISWSSQCFCKRYVSDIS